MPWKETDVMNERTEFVLLAMRGAEDFGRLCGRFGISRKTGYKWKQRFLERGLDGLADESRRPHDSPTQVVEDVACRIVKLKLAHPHWGPRKIREVFARSRPGEASPSESTFKRVLDKAGLVARRRRRRRDEQGGRVENRIAAERPNHVWTVDFKGWWYTRDRSRFEPLTIRDDFSRYVLCAQAMENSRTETVREQFDRVFRAHGLPEVIRSDNGDPFAATNSPLGLSRLSAWWLTLGIDLDRIRPGRPDQNGGHERMHRDMAIEVERRAEADAATQQASLDTWRDAFNHQRPHESLGMRVPGELYRPSPRRYEPEDAELDYPAHHLVRKVGRKGNVKVRGLRVDVSTALAGHRVGLEPTGDQCLSVWFCRLCLGRLDLETAKFHAATGL
jgi:putative transposase